eukprot:gene31636-41070_t
MFSPIFVIFIAFMVASVLSIDGGLRQDQVEVESTRSKKPHWSPTKKPTEDLSLGEQLKKPHTSKKPTDAKTKKPFWSPTKKPSEDLTAEESKKPRNSKKPRAAKTEKPSSLADGFLVSSKLAADSTEQPPQLEDKATCEGDYYYECKGCGYDSICCKKECNTLTCDDIATYCKI